MNLEKAVKVLDSMQLPNGAYVASPSKDYSYVWIRDVVYSVLPFLYFPSIRYEEAFHAMLDLFKSYEWKIDIHTKKRPEYLFEYIHSRYSKNLKELPVEWGHAQNDAIGIFLWGVGKGTQHGYKIIRDKSDTVIIQKLVDYLDCLNYWEAIDNGMWEENMEVHASSVGACVAGLEAVKMIVNVKEELIEKGKETLEKLLPRESQTKETDLALLSLIFPLRVVNHQMAEQILEKVTTTLERRHGSIRYVGDAYYNEGREAEWCFGFPWIGLCYSELGLLDKAEQYIPKTKKNIPKSWEVPELYIGGKEIPNNNTPLAWAVSLSYLFLKRMELTKVTDDPIFYLSIV